MNGEDWLEIATTVNFQLDNSNQNDYIIRKTHYLPPKLKEARKEDIEKVVYIYRDFRDVLISAFFYQHKKIDESDVCNGAVKSSKNSFQTFKKYVVECITGEPKKILLEFTESLSKCWSDDIGSWSNHINTWLNFSENNEGLDIVFISYESLLNNTLESLKKIICGLQLEMPSDDHLKKAINRQSFQTQKKHFESFSNDDLIPFGNDFNIKFLRKGVAGDWMNFFTKEMGGIVDEYNGEMLRKLGYITNPNWYKRL